MKLHPMILALSAAAATSTAHASAPGTLAQGCENMIRAAAAAINTDWINPDEGTGNITIAKEDLAAVKITNVKVLHSSCIGPDDCDAQNPDAFTWGANVNGKGRVVVSYHRGNCSISKFSLGQ
jgi:hypothetical protein